MEPYIEILTNIFERNCSEAQAKPMEKYMKNKFPFLGIKKPLRAQLEKQFFASSAILKEPFQHEFILDCWKKEEREFQYTALTYIEKSLKKLQKQDLDLIETLIATKSWWDTVDMLASKPVGRIAMEYPEVINGRIDKWAADTDIWLRRTAILFQLKYKNKTDEQLLYKYILQNADSKEFFIQKAIGWALREYSKTNPESVKNFLAEHQVSPLSFREGSKYLT